MKDGPEGEPVADLPAMYWKYAKGWMAIDLLSVAPTVAMLFVDTSEDAAADPQQSKAIKAIRLIRLAKLLRLVRGARLFKKYEELFGKCDNCQLSVLLVSATLLLLPVCFDAGWLFRSIAEPDYDVWSNWSCLPLYHMSLVRDRNNAFSGDRFT